MSSSSRDNLSAKRMKERELLRWALADHTFREARELIEHVIEQKIDTESHLFNACLAGIVVTYCRPFMEANGLGPLPKEMTQFKGVTKGEVMQAAHDMLFEARNSMVAHFDRLHQENLFQKGDFLFSPSEVIVDLESVGSRITTNVMNVPPELLNHALGLCILQMERCGTKLAAFGHQLFFENDGKAGRYVFKVEDAVRPPPSSPLPPASSPC